jgi:hypothetical protein
VPSGRVAIAEAKMSQDDIPPLVLACLVVTFLLLIWWLGAR